MLKVPGNNKSKLTLSQSIIPAAFTLRWSHLTTPSRAHAVHKTALSAQSCLQACRFPGPVMLRPSRVISLSLHAPFTAWLDLLERSHGHGLRSSPCCLHAEGRHPTRHAHPAHPSPGNPGHGCCDGPAPPHVKSHPTPRRSPVCRGSSPRCAPTVGSQSPPLFGQLTSCFPVYAKSCSACVPQPGQRCGC